MIPLLVWGASGHAGVVAEAIEAQSHYRICGFIDNANLNLAREFRNQPLYPSLEMARRQHAEVKHVIVAIGDCSARFKIAEMCTSAGLQLATIIHPHAWVSPSAKLSGGCVVMAGCVIQARCLIGNNVILNTASSLDHDGVLEGAVHLAPGVHVGGHVHIGCRTWVGLGASIIDHLQIGADIVIGAGATVVHNLVEPGVYCGIPARPMEKGKHDRP